jgi:hypothetical protein
MGLTGAHPGGKGEELNAKEGREAAALACPTGCSAYLGAAQRAPYFLFLWRMRRRNFLYLWLRIFCRLAFLPFIAPFFEES